jgi:hypothetical protein
MKRINTIHTSRTIMFAELFQVMNRGIESADFDEVLKLNVANKLSNRNLIKTNAYLKQLYRFDNSDLAFSCFRHYWKLADNSIKSKIALLFALNNDSLLSESIDLVASAPVSEKIAIEKFDENIEKYHPERYSANTRHSAAQNVASSWKQAGYIEGKVKNIRVKPQHNYLTVAFAFLLSFVNGDRGEYILMSKMVKSLALETEEVRELIRQAATHDLLQYQYGGNVTSISFENQLNSLI